jgi:hypothetical protein
MNENEKTRMTNDERCRSVGRRVGRWPSPFVIRISSFVILSLLLCTPLRAKEGAIQCGMLIYAGTKTSRCFSDEFLSTVQQKTSIATERRFKFVKMGTDDLFAFPFVVMTGEGDFTLSQRERENLKKYLSSGGFLLASAGCSNKDWDNAFRREMKKVMAEHPMKGIASTHPLFRTVFQLEKMKLSKSSGEAKLDGVEYNGRLVVVYSSQGLNNTANTSGCCCCGGNEIGNSLEVNVNIVAYALLH